MNKSDKAREALARLSEIACNMCDKDLDKDTLKDIDRNEKIVLKFILGVAKPKTGG